MSISIHKSQISTARTRSDRYNNVTNFLTRSPLQYSETLLITLKHLTIHKQLLIC